MRRSDSCRTWATAGRMASKASARTTGWKLPLLIRRPSAMDTRGLSSEALSSVSTASQATSRKVRKAPCTWGATRNESGSWTEGVPRGGVGPSTGDDGEEHGIGRPDGPDLGHDGMDRGVQERDEDLRGADARAGASAGQAAQSRSHRGADDARWQWRTHAAGMRRHDPILVARQRFARHALVAHVTQAGIEAVDEIRSIYRSIDHGLAGADPVQGCGRQFDACSGNHLEELFEAERLLGNGDQVRACEGHDAGLSRYAASLSTRCTRQPAAATGVAQ